MQSNGDAVPKGRSYKIIQNVAYMKDYFTCNCQVMGSYMYNTQIIVEPRLYSFGCQVIWWRNEKARPKNFNAVSHNHVRS